MQRLFPTLTSQLGKGSCDGITGGKATAALLGLKAKHWQAFALSDLQQLRQENQRTEEAAARMEVAATWSRQNARVEGTLPRVKKPSRQSCPERIQSSIDQRQQKKNIPINTPLLVKGNRKKLPNHHTATAKWCSTPCLKSQDKSFFFIPPQLPLHTSHCCRLAHADDEASSKLKHQTKMKH